MSSRKMFRAAVFALLGTVTACAAAKVGKDGPTPPDDAIDDPSNFGSDDPEFDAAAEDASTKNAVADDASREARDAEGAGEGAAAAKAMGASKGPSDGGAEGAARLDGSLPDAPKAIAAEAGAGCADDLSNIGAGDFRITFTLTTTMVGHAALLNQRAICDYSQFWDVHAAFPARDGIDASTAAFLYVETDDDSHATNYTTMNSPVVMNDGQPHAVVVTRAGGRLTATVDGTSTFATSNAAFGVLAPLAQGTDVCSAVDHRVPFTGTLANVCVTH